MAGRGPAPKQEGQRRRRNAPERGEWVDLKPLGEPVLPELDGAREWHPRTVALWEAWREDPATGMYGPAERAAVVELAYLTDEFVTGGDPEVRFQRVTPAELRQRMDGLGLTAKGKRDLRWRTVAEAGTGEKPQEPGEVVAFARPVRAV